MPFQAHTIEAKTGQTPRKVVAGYFLSLDGVAEAPDRFVTAWDDETDAGGASLIATQDAVILGRRSYDEWAEFWPGSEIKPFASFINAVPKYVATSTPLEREWANSRVIEGRLVDSVRHLKGLPGGDIGVHGSISVTRTLLDADLVDELRLVVLVRPMSNSSAIGLHLVTTEHSTPTSSPDHEFTQGLYGWITHTEFASDDPGATRAWAAEALGWTFQPSFPTPAGDYHLFAYSESGGGGIRGTRAHEAPGVTPSVHVQDTDASYASALAAGAESVAPPETIMPGVRTALVRAPGGVLIGFSGPSEAAS